MASRNSLILLAFLSCVGCGAGKQTPGAAGSSDPLRDQKAEWLFARGQESAERGDTVRAEEYLELAIDRGYDRHRALPILLGVCLSSGRLRAALNYAEPELRVRPDDPELRYLVASIRLGLGQASEAKSELETVLRQKPSHASAEYLLGVIELDELHDPDSAKSHFQKYLKLSASGKHAPEVRSRLSELEARQTAPVALESVKPEDIRLPRYQPYLRGPAVAADPAPPSDSDWFDVKPEGAP